MTKTVNAKQIWQSMGVTVAKGDVINITYLGGRWSVNPAASNLTAAGTGHYKGKGSFALPGANEGALVGRIGSAPPMLIGTAREIPSGGMTGELQLATNDDLLQIFTKGYSDNSGSIDVKISIKIKPISTAATDLAVDPARKIIFWGQSTAPFSLRRADLDGTNYRIVMPKSGAAITSVALDTVNQRVYVIVGTGRILSVGYDGGDQQDVRDISGPAKESFWQIEVDNDNQQLYWTNDFGIWRAGLSGGNARMIVSPHDAPYPIDLSVDGEQKKLYWVDRELKVVRRSNLDGTNPEDLYAVAHPMRGLTIDEVLQQQQSTLKKEVYWSAWEERITAGTPGIAGRWQLDAGRGDELADSTKPFASARRTVVAAEREDLPPPLRSPAFALRFDGPSDFLRLPQERTDSLASGSFTVQLWIKVDSLPQSDRALLSVGSAWANNKLLHLVIRAKKPYFGFYLNDTAGKIEVKEKQWVHLAFRYDKDNKTQAIFVDGVLDAITDGHEPLQLAAGTPGLLGRYAGANEFVGLMADLHIVDRALSDVEIGVGRSSATPGDIMKEISLGPTWVYDTGQLDGNPPARDLAGAQP